MKSVASLILFLLVVMPCAAQQPSAPVKSAPSSRSGASGNVQLPPGMTLSVALTSQLSSASTSTGSSVYVQIISPVIAGDQVAIPAGTYLQGTIAKITQKSGRVYFQLNSASLAYVNGYVAAVAAPLELRSDSGWLRPAPESHPGRTIAFIMAPVIGAGIGAGVGAATNPGSSGGFTTGPDGTTVLKPATLPGTAKGAAIGGGIGAAVMVGGLLLTHSGHAPNFYLHVGSPMTVELQGVVPIDPQRALDAGALPPPAIVPLARLPQPPSPSSNPFPPPPPPPQPPTIIPGTPAIGNSLGTPTVVIP